MTPLADNQKEQALLFSIIQNVRCLKSNQLHYLPIESQVQAIVGERNGWREVGKRDGDLIGPMREN